MSITNHPELNCKQKIMLYISTQCILALQPSNITKVIKNTNTQTMKEFFLHAEYLTII